LTSPDAPQGIPTPPDADAFPPGPPHTVDAYTRPRWPAALSRWWRGVFERDASARGGYMAGNRGGDQRYFPQRADGPSANGGPPPTP
jgi:hypothetical protein